MARIVVGMFDHLKDAEAAERDLVDSGFSRDDINLISKDVKGKFAQLFQKKDDLSDMTRALVNAGIPEDQARAYAERTHRGGTLLTVNCSDDMAQPAAHILNRHHSSGVDREVTGQQMDETVMQRDETAMRTDKTRLDEGDTTVFPVIDEEMRVGKRETDAGGVQVQSTMEEKPVEETVDLRREHVDVERRPVDRPASDADFDTFKEGTMEVREHSEEPVVEKRARVVEEVEVKKNAEETQQTIRDTVRHTDVEVNRLDAQGQTQDMGMDEYDAYFQNHFNNHYNNTSYTYDQYRPFYEYGSTLANDPRYQGWTWERIEPVARQYYSSDQNTRWDDIKEAVHEGWSRSTHKM